MSSCVGEQRPLTVATVDSCYFSLLFPRSWVPSHHPLLRTLVKLAAPPRRSVSTSCTFSPANTSTALTFVLAPLPNALFGHCGADDSFSAESEGSAAVDLGRFLTSVTVLTGFAFPLVLAHSEVIKMEACVMSIIGGGLVYGTILAYSQVFKEDTSEF